MNQHDQMREALREIQISAEDCANGKYPWPHKQNYSDIAEHARRALSHVNETPKNEHDSADVLKRAPLVRLTEGEINELADLCMLVVVNNSSHSNSKNFDTAVIDKYDQFFAKAIMDAMQEKNK